MKKEDVKKVIKYWQKTAEHDYEVMLYLFKGKKYSESLFFGHIILEKILKDRYNIVKSRCHSCGGRNPLLRFSLIINPVVNGKIKL
jgi:hypothetical protein